MKSGNALLKDKSVLDFVESARAFCSLVENQHNYAKVNFLKEVHRSLAALYLRALSLPDTEPCSEEPSASHVAEPDLGRVLEALADKLGEHRFYSLVFDPFDKNEKEPMVSDLAGDLGEIYSDLKDALIVYDTQTAEAVRDAVWDWRFGFQTHWGRHLLEAQRAIFWLLFDYLGND